MTEETLTEEELASAIYQKIDEFNILIKQAGQRGIIVSAEIYDLATFSSSAQTYRIEIQILKPLERGN